MLMYTFMSITLFLGLSAHPNWYLIDIQDENPVKENAVRRNWKDILSEEWKIEEFDSKSTEAKITEEIGEQIKSEETKGEKNEKEKGEEKESTHVKGNKEKGEVAVEGENSKEKGEEKESTQVKGNKEKGEIADKGENSKQKAEEKESTQVKGNKKKGEVAEEGEKSEEEEDYEPFIPVGFQKGQPNQRDHYGRCIEWNEKMKRVQLCGDVYPGGEQFDCHSEEEANNSLKPKKADKIDEDIFERK